MSGENAPHSGSASIRDGNGWGVGKQQVVSGTLSEVRFDPALMVPDLQSPDRMGAIKEMVNRLHSAGCVTDSLAFLQSVLDREDLESTVLEEGVAFPHARCRSTTRLDVVFGISRQGVDFHSERYPQRVHLLCLLAVPVIGEEDHLHLLGMLAGRFRDRTFRSGLLRCHTSEEMYRFLCRSVLKGQRDRAWVLFE